QVRQDRLLVGSRPTEAGALGWFGHGVAPWMDPVPRRRPGCRRLQLFGLGVVLTVAVGPAAGLRVVSGHRGGIELRRAVLQAQAQLRERELDLVDRLLPEVADVEQVRLAALDQLADG